MLRFDKVKTLVLLVLFALIATACQPVVTSDTGAAGEAEDTRGHLNESDDYSFGLASTLDPHDPNRYYTYVVMAYDTLVAKDINGNHTPALATAWTPNEDATQWVITLREGVLFHDGTEMKAPDVAYSLMRLTDPEVNSPLLGNFEIVQSVEATGDYEITINLDPANVDMPELLTAYQSAIIKDNAGETIGEDGIGTGPFKLQNLDFPGVTELVAHDEYWGGKPGLASANIIAISDSEARIQAMLSGQIDFLSAGADQLALFDSNEDVEIQNFPGGAWHALVMRTDTPPFDDPRVRKAIRLAADREEIVAQALDGRGVVTCDHPVWTGDIYRANIDCGQDIELAKSLLADAGYSDGIDIDIHTSPLVAEWVPMLETYQAQAAEAGIRLNIVQTPSDGFWSEVWMTEAFATTAWGERSAAEILPTAYRGGASWNETYYNNPEFDDLLDAAAAEVDLDKRIGIYAQLQNTLWEDGGSLVPYHLNESRIVKTCLEGLEPIGEFHIDYSKISKPKDC